MCESKNRRRVFRQVRPATTIVDGVANDLAATIESMPGYEAAIKSPTSGSLGKIAAQAGADMYLLVQTTEYQDGAEIAIVTPYSAFDEPLGASSRIRLSNWRFPQDFDASALFSAAGVPTTKDSRRLLIPGGTQVVVSTLDTISSANAGANDTFAFRAASDVIVDGFIAIKKVRPDTVRSYRPMERRVTVKPESCASVSITSRAQTAPKFR